jgi:AbrB family looped-hinge helix DNA binding protein
LTAIISKLGSSQGLRLPKSIVKDLNLSIGDELKIITKDKKIILEPIKKQKKRYDEVHLKTKLKYKI